MAGPGGQEFSPQPGVRGRLGRSNGRNGGFGRRCVAGDHVRGRIQPLAGVMPGCPGAEDRGDEKYGDRCEGDVKLGFAHPVGWSTINSSRARGSAVASSSKSRQGRFALESTTFFVIMTKCLRGGLGWKPRP